MTIHEIDCPHCLGSGTSPTSGMTCHTCGGDGDVAPLGTNKLSEVHSIESHTLLVALTEVVNDIKDKVDDIKEKVDEIKEVVDEL